MTTTTKTTPKKIEFAPTTDQDLLIAPWDNPAASSFHDLVLKPEFSPRKFKFPLGSTWFRILPPLPASKKGWMLGINVLKYAGGQHVHARSVKAGGKCVFDLAYAWLRENRPGVLFSKSNMAGIRLLPSPVSVFWILVEEAGKTVGRLVVASGYDGSRGGTPGYGHQILRATQELDENGCLVAKPAHPTEGVQICIEKSQPPGAKYPCYALRVGRTPAPVDQFLARMDPDEYAALTAGRQMRWESRNRAKDGETGHFGRYRVDEKKAARHIGRQHYGKKISAGCGGADWMGILRV